MKRRIPEGSSGAKVMTFEERVHALAPIGLPRRQTEFLVRVALHGGYCLQRQYDAFTGRAHGQIACDFFDRLVTWGLATRVQFARHRGGIYHLHAKSLYRAIGQGDNRNRRQATPAHIARKLMVLDYVLAARSRGWLATEQDKVALFTTRFGLATIDLPHRRYASRYDRDPGRCRYFVHKLPIAVVEEEGTVEFVYLVLDESGAGLETFLADHLRLLSRLDAWTIVAVCPRHINGLAACRRMIARTFPSSAAGHLAPPDRDELRWFFRVRAAIDRDDWRDLSISDLNRFRELRQRLPAAPTERLYASWQRLEDAVLASDERDGLIGPAPRERLVEYTLPFGYEQFGSWPGLA
jgi:hypothetical protein